jgi:uncharacterized protein (UPF0333 family)
MNKKGQIRFNFGMMDGFSLLLFGIGIYMLMIEKDTAGWILIILAFVKQFSGR